MCDRGDNTVKVFSPEGTQLLHTISDQDRAFLCFAVCYQNMYNVSYYSAHIVKVFSQKGVFLHSIGAPKYGDGQLNGPAGITTDRFSNLVVCDCVNKRLQIFSLDGKVLSILEGQHIGLGDPYSVAVSSTGQLFVTDAEKQCVHVFQ